MHLLSGQLRSKAHVAGSQTFCTLSGFAQGYSDIFTRDVVPLVEALTSRVNGAREAKESYYEVPTVLPPASWNEVPFECANIAPARAWARSAAPCACAQARLRRDKCMLAKTEEAAKLFAANEKNDEKKCSTEPPKAIWNSCAKLNCALQYRSTLPRHITRLPGLAACAQALEGGGCAGASRGEARGGGCRPQG